MDETRGYHWEWSQNHELLKMNEDFAVQFFPHRRDNYSFIVRLLIASDNRRNMKNPLI